MKVAYDEFKESFGCLRCQASHCSRDSSNGRDFVRTDLLPFLMPFSGDNLMLALPWLMLSRNANS